MGLFKRREKKEPAKRKPEEIATSLVDAIIATYQMMEKEQQVLLLELSYSSRDRFTLSLQLAQVLYKSGLLGYPQKDLHTYMTEGELQAVLYCLVCGDSQERIVRQATVRLLQRPDFQHYASTQPQQQQPAKNAQTASPVEGEDGDVPSLSQRDRAARRGANALRTRRPGGRTLRRDAL